MSPVLPTRAARASCLVAVLALGVACTAARRAAAPAPQPTDLAPAPEGGPASGSRPVTNYKDERVSQALAGLDYDSGRVAPSAEAQDVLGRLDRGDLARLLDEGRALAASNARLEAIAAVTRGVLLAPDSVEALELLGDVLRTERLEARSEAAYRSALELAPESSRLHTKLAEVLWLGPRSAQALDEARSAIRLDPTNATAWRRIALWSYYANDDASAWQATQRAEALGADVPPQFRRLLAARTPEPAR